MIETSHENKTRSWCINTMNKCYKFTEKAVKFYSFIAMCHTSPSSAVARIWFCIYESFFIMVLCSPYLINKYKIYVHFIHCNSAVWQGKVFWYKWLGTCCILPHPWTGDTERYNIFRLQPSWQVRSQNNESNLDKKWAILHFKWTNLS